MNERKLLRKRKQDFGYTLADHLFPTDTSPSHLTELSIGSLNVQFENFVGSVFDTITSL